jgi:hypothetical protein
MVFLVRMVFTAVFWGLVVSYYEGEYRFILPFAGQFFGRFFFEFQLGDLIGRVNFVVLTPGFLAAEIVLVCDLVNFFRAESLET